MEQAAVGEELQVRPRRGKVRERAEARRLRAEGKTYDEIVRALGVSKSSVSLWVRDLPRPVRVILDRENWAADLTDADRQGLGVQLWRQGKSRSDLQRALGLSAAAVDHLLGAVGAPDAEAATRGAGHLRQAARVLRAAGWTHDQIARELNISTSSSSAWTTDIGRSADEISDQPQPRRWNAMVRRRTDQRRRQQKLDAANSLAPMTREHLIVAAVIAYWCEGEKDKPYARRETLGFLNSDARLIQLWLRFLEEMAVDPERLRFRVQIHETADVEAARNFWAGTAGVPAEFIKVSLKHHAPTSPRRNVGDGYHGCLGVRVLKGADLYRQVDGWFQAIVAGALRLPVETSPDAALTSWKIATLDLTAFA